MLAFRRLRALLSGGSWLRMLLVAVAAPALMNIGAAVADAAAPVPCSPAGTINGQPKFNCQFYPSGDGISGGAPVHAGSGQRVGYLRRGTNYVFCQKVGRRQTSGRYFNNNWAWTLADNLRYGWVNAVYARGGDNDGPFGGVPSCGNAQGQPPSGPGPSVTPPPARPSLPTPQGGYASYHKEYFINRLPRYNVRQLMRQFNSNVDGYFTFTGCGEHLELGETCQLKIPLGHAPVMVIAVTDSGFALKSLPGHPEGAGRIIRFEFRPYDVVGNPTLKQLVVEAWGPVSAGSLLGPFNSATVAQVSWEILTKNINSRFPDKPPLDDYVI